MKPMPHKNADTNAQIYLVGGGIASLAASAFFIRDGDVRGHNITIVEESARIGGSLDAAGTPESGYVMRGGRMLESKYLCTWDLFSSIPTLDERSTVTEEIFAWNQTMKTASKARLFRAGQPIDAPSYGLGEQHILTLERVALAPESMLGRRSIADEFDSSFFKTGFWLMWCTTFAFQPWHSAVEFKRYLLRFVHMVDGFNTLHGIMRTVYNQYDSMVRPLEKWLLAHGVQFRLNTRVGGLDLHHETEGFTVRAIHCEHEQGGEDIRVNACDKVLITLGSMTEASSLGAMDEAAPLRGQRDGGAWALWESVAAFQPQFGRPANFTGHIAESKWMSFTTTLHDSTFFDRVRDLTGNVPGEGGLITFPDSRWLASIVLPHQPHFLGQPADVNVFWGYGLFVDKSGDYVRKSMSASTGREIMTEIIGHLGLEADADRILASCTCIPCMMPFITSQFLCRSRGDRPHVIPAGSRNLAFIGQFCELPEDVVFTVEYSIRSAQTAAYAMLSLDRKPPQVYKGDHDPRVLLRAFLELHEQDVPEAILL
jgi:oleate hydratase